eukprot:2620044-Prymnesium_polylepis.2
MPVFLHQSDEITRRHPTLPILRSDRRARRVWLHRACTATGQRHVAPALTGDEARHVARHSVDPNP